MASDHIAAIRDSVPPTTDYMTYLTIVESHLFPEVLPALNEILQDTVLTQNIGWDLIQTLLPLPGAEGCLNTIARLGNPREVVLKVTEALRMLYMGEQADEDVDNEVPSGGDSITETSSAPKTIDKFRILLSLLSTLHPRIKTKYPSRFLSTSLMAVIYSYRPSDEATSAVISFVHALSGTKRPPLPQRKSSTAAPLNTSVEAAPPAPDPEATAEEPQEEAIQRKLLQSFVTHILEDYINTNRLEWSARLQEHYYPERVVPDRSFGGRDPALQERDATVGQLIALTRDLGLSNLDVLFTAIFSESPPPETSHVDNLPSSPDDIPLSRVGCLFLVTYFIFSSILFDTNFPLPQISIFPDHLKLVSQFVGIGGPGTTGTEEEGTIDAVLAIGLWLERSNKFVSGPLEDEDFLQHLQTLSLLSANSPSPTIRYAAHVLTSSVLHAHPADRTRLAFIADTLENCPFENLKGSAVAWLKEEIITAAERKTDNIFSSTVALTSVQPYLFPDMSQLVEASDLEAWDEIKRDFTVHMAVLNFLYFLSGEAYASVVPPGTLTVAEKIYLEPLGMVLERLEASLLLGGEICDELGEDSGVALAEIQLLRQRLAMCMEDESETE